MQTSAHSKTGMESADLVMDSSVFQARHVYEQLESWMMAEAMLLPEHKVEAALNKRGREVHRLLLQAHLAQRGTGKVGASINVTEGSEVHCHEAGPVHARKITTIFGDVKAERTAYTCEGRTSVHPLDDELKLPQRSYSYELAQRVVEESVRGPYDEGCENIQKNTGVVVPKRSAEKIVEDAAEDFDAFYKQRTAPTKDTGPILVAAVDCKGVPMVKPKRAERLVRRTKGQKANKKKMATVAAVFTIQPRVRTPEDVADSLFSEKPAAKVDKTDVVRPENKRVWAKLAESKDEMLQEVAKEVNARDPEQEKKTRVAVTDGERGLQMRVKKYLIGVVLILDFLHVLEKLWIVAHALYGEGSDSAVEWVKTHALMILQGKVRTVVRGIKQSVTKRNLTGAKRKALLGVAHYLYSNRERMEYDKYLQKGWPIASGAVEGACKNLVKDRMERSGMRWKIRGADAILKMRAVKLSGDFEAYWQFHIEQDQKRLFGCRQWKVAA